MPELPQPLTMPQSEMLINVGILRAAIRRNTELNKQPMKMYITNNRVTPTTWFCISFKYKQVKTKLIEMHLGKGK